LVFGAFVGRAGVVLPLGLGLCEFVELGVVLLFLLGGVWGGCY